MKGERERGRGACALGAEDNCTHVGWHGGAVWSYSAGKWFEARLKKTVETLALLMSTHAV